jgi:hypothetical protein
VIAGIIITNTHGQLPILPRAIAGFEDLILLIIRRSFGDAAIRLLDSIKLKQQGLTRIQRKSRGTEFGEINVKVIIISSIILQ